MAKETETIPKLEIHRVALDQLHADPANARLHDQRNLDAIVSSLTEFGQVEPLVVRKETGKVIGGSGRLEAMRRMGWTECDVVEVETDNVKASALGIALNRTAELATWDDAALASTLQALRDEDFDLQAVGFDDAELAEVLASVGTGTGEPAGEDAGPQLDRAAELQEKWQTRFGQLWVIPSKTVPGKEHRLLCGDSTKPDDVARVMAGDRAKLILTDPPYAVDYVEKARDMNCRGYGHSRGKSAAAIAGDQIEAGQEEGLWREAFLTAYSQALTPDAAFYCWHAQGRAMLVLYNLLASIGLLHHQTIIWKKNNFVIGRCDYQWIHEPCFYGWMKGHRPPFYGEKNQTTVWDVSRDTNSPDHPTQKPVAIFTPPITNHLKPGESLYEPFAGSGTALVAAEQTGRIARGIELSERYVAVCLERLSDLGLEPELISDGP